MWTADSKAARLTIPYLGPQPPPSRPTSVVLMVACGVVAAIQMVKMALFLRQAQVEQRFLDLPSLAQAHEVRSAQDQLSSVSKISLVAIIVTVIIDLVWRNQRRPKERRTRQGEAYVEFPIIWVTPVALRVGWAAIGLGSYFLSTAARTTSTTLPADFPHARQMSALSSAGWTFFWLSLLVWVVVVNRTHDRRVAWSAPYRTDPSQVPFFPPVAGIGLFSSGSSSAQSSRSTASGIWWVLSTAGLVMLCFFGVGAVIGGVAEIGYGHPTGVVWLAAGLGSWAFVIWVMVRRYQQGKL